MMKLRLASLALLLLGAAQQPQTTTPTFLETLDVRITSLDVVVTDRAGKPVRGLRAQDFELRENGVPQPITNFAEYSGSAGLAEMPAAAPAATPAAAAPAETVSAPPPRRFLFFIDEMSLQGRTRGKLIDQTLALVHEQMRPGDEAMVITPAMAQRIALDFTADRALVEQRLRETIDQQASLSARGRARSEQFFYDAVVRKAGSPREYISQARVYSTRVNRRVTSTLRTLLGIVGSLNQTPGKKVLVLVGNSLTSQPGREAFSALTMRSSVAAAAESFGAGLPEVPDSESRTVFSGSETQNVAYFDVRPMIEELGARASANGVTIYSVQPDPGVQISPPGASPEVHGRGGIVHERRGDVTITDANFAVSSFQRGIVEGTRETLKTLADTTGGKYFVGDGQLAGGFRQIAEDLSSYYSIAYRVDASTGSDAVRRIDVAVKNHPGLTVRTRREMLRRSPEREMDEMVAATLIAPRAINELGITASAARPQRALDSYKVDVSVKIPLEKLTFIPVGDKYRASFTVHYAAADGADYTTGTFREQTLQVAPAEIDAVRTKMYTYTTTLVVAPGTATIAVGVYDKFSRLSGFERLQVAAR